MANCEVATTTSVSGAVFVLGALFVGRLAGLYGWTELLALLPLVVVAFVQGWLVLSITVAQDRRQWGASRVRGPSVGCCR